jgi:branched-subunit amino acid permease
MKLLVTGILIGLALGVMLTVIYFSLATFFGAESRRTAKQKSPEESIKRSEGTAVLTNMKARAGK